MIQIAFSRTKATHAPSGDHCGSDTACSDAVSWRARPVLTSMIATWRVPPASTVQAMRRPSGDRRGSRGESTATICSTVSLSRRACAGGTGLGARPGGRPRRRAAGAAGGLAAPAAAPSASAAGASATGSAGAAASAGTTFGRFFEPGGRPRRRGAGGAGGAGSASDAVVAPGAEVGSEVDGPKAGTAASRAVPAFGRSASSALSTLSASSERAERDIAGVIPRRGGPSPALPAGAAARRG